MAAEEGTNYLHRVLGSWVVPEPIPVSIFLRLLNCSTHMTRVVRERAVFYRFQNFLLTVDMESVEPAGYTLPIFLNNECGNINVFVVESNETITPSWLNNETWESWGLKYILYKFKICQSCVFSRNQIKIVNDTFYSPWRSKNFNAKGEEKALKYL